MREVDGLEEGSRRLPARSSSARVNDDRDLLEPLPTEVAHVVDVVELEQDCDATTLGRRSWNTQQEVTVPQRFVVDRQGQSVVT